MLKIAKCKHFFFFIIKVKYLFYWAIMSHFFCQKKSKCRDFDQKINQTPLLHSDKFMKVKYLNSTYYIVLFHDRLVKQIFHFSTKIKRNVYIWQFLAQKRQRSSKRNLSISLSKICRCVKSIKPQYYTETNFQKWNTKFRLLHGPLFCAKNCQM